METYYVSTNTGSIWSTFHSVVPERTLIRITSWDRKIAVRTATRQKDYNYEVTLRTQLDLASTYHIAIGYRN